MISFFVLTITCLIVSVFVYRIRGYRFILIMILIRIKTHNILKYFHCAHSQLVFFLLQWTNRIYCCILLTNVLNASKKISFTTPPLIGVSIYVYPIVFFSSCVLAFSFKHSLTHSSQYVYAFAHVVYIIYLYFYICSARVI